MRTITTQAELDAAAELKPCHRCGSAAERATVGDARFIICSKKNCLVSAYGLTWSEAIAVWNTRPREAELEAERNLFERRLKVYEDAEDDDYRKMCRAAEGETDRMIARLRAVVDAAKALQIEDDSIDGMTCFATSDELKDVVAALSALQPGDRGDGEDDLTST